MGEHRASGPSRRTVLKAGAAAAAGTLFFPAVVRGGWKNIQNVIIARFGGGVRFQETFGDPLLRNLPGIGKNLLKQGTLYSNIYNDWDTTHSGATQQILTGKPFQPSKSSRNHPTEPTLFEFFRKEKGRRAGPQKCVVVEHSTVDFHYNESTHLQYGFNFGGWQFQPRLITYHHLNKVLQAEQDQNNDVCRLARGLQDRIWVEEDFEHIEDTNRAAPTFVEPGSKFINNLFSKDRVPRVNSGDELVLHFALAAMESKEFQPRVMMINFAGPDIAHRGSYSAYTARIRALDGLIEQLWNGIRKNRVYAKTTLLFVTPDCGRSLSGKGKGGFTDHWARDDGCRHTWALLLGGGIPKKQFARQYTQLDIAPTLGEILGIPTPGCEGVVMSETRK